MSLCVRRFAMLVLCSGLFACTSGRHAPVEQHGNPPPASSKSPTRALDPRPGLYIVKKGDTLYSIALDNGFDYRELAAWNNLDNVNIIHIGQTLRLTAPDNAGVGVAQTKPLLDTPVVVILDEPKISKLPYSDAALSKMTQSAKPSVSQGKPADAKVPDTKPVDPKPVDPKMPDPKPLDPKQQDAKPQDSKSTAPTTDAVTLDNNEETLAWVWPVKGKVLSGFGNGSSKGVDLANDRGTPVLSAMSGKVVYAGTGLRGYGKLIILKHNKVFLSAYAHNDKLLVKEGQMVSRGQKIAEMGDTDTEQVKLHFEIRRFGTPVDPLKFLPAP